MERSPIRDFVVGLFVLAGIGAIAYLSLSIGGLNLRNPKHLVLTAAFDQTGGLAVDAPVVIAGVRVGKITRIYLGDDYRARVQLSLDPTLKLPTDTGASIVTAGVLGDRYIELSPGGEDTLLKNGDQIAYTESAVLLEKLISQFIYGSTKSKPGAAAPTTNSTAPHS